MGECVESPLVRIKRHGGRLCYVDHVEVLRRRHAELLGPLRAEGRHDGGPSCPIVDPKRPHIGW
jgi:hypothetical protein